MPVVDESELLDTRGAARVLNCSAGTLAFWRFEGKLDLPYVKVGHKVCYRRRDLEDFIARRTIRPKKSK